VIEAIMWENEIMEKMGNWFCHSSKRMSEGTAARYLEKHSVIPENAEAATRVSEVKPFHDTEAKRRIIFLDARNSTATDQ
jgi:hypothetical protein